MNVRKWLDWHSAYIFGLLAAFPAAWLTMPQLQAMLPPRVVSIIAPCVAGLGLLLELRKQIKAVKPPVPPKEDS